MIKKLSSNLINKIAAGEVVERPASVVKELVENAIDAGSSRITVEIEKGGYDRIRIIDNGSGMSSDDAGQCIERYATSKITKYEDLVNVETLGFRGEALAAISAVSMFTLQTKRPQDMSGTQVLVKGSTPAVSAVGCPDGTLVSVDNLFFNVPARRKFLKSVQVEYNRIADIVLNYMLLHPEIRWELKHNGKSMLAVEATDDWKKRVIDVVGNDVGDSLIHLDYRYNDIHVTGYVASPSVARSHRNEQYVFVNGRAVKDFTISNAVKRGMDPMIDRALNPVFVLKLSLPPEDVDVNVHPRKTEVAFANQQSVYMTVYTAVKNTLHNAYAADKGVSNEGFTHVSPDAGRSISQGMSGVLRSSNAPRPQSFSMMQRPKISGTQVMGQVQTLMNDSHSDDVDPLRGWNLIGQMKKSYLVVETDDRLLVFDQHAAAEAVMFKKLKEDARKQQVSKQNLLTPYSYDVSVRESQLISQHIDVFASLGFEVEHFGGSTYIVRTIPADIVKYGTGDVFKKVLEDLEKEDVSPSASLEDMQDIILKFAACRSSIMFGDELNREEQLHLLRQIRETGVIHCPHGRPIVWEMSWDDVNKQFGR